MVVVVDNAAGTTDACEGCVIVLSFEFLVSHRLTQIDTDFYKTYLKLLNYISLTEFYISHRFLRFTQIFIKNLFETLKLYIDHKCGFSRPSEWASKARAHTDDLEIVNFETLKLYISHRFLRFTQIFKKTYLKHLIINDWQRYFIQGKRSHF